MNLVQNGIMTGTETTEFFSDGIGSVHVTGNLVRIDFVTLQPHLQGAAESEGKPVFAVKHRCVMPLESFIQSLSVQEDIVQKLMAAASVRPPAGIRTAAPRMEQVLTEKRDALRSAIDDVRQQIESLRGAAAAA